MWRVSWLPPGQLEEQVLPAGYNLIVHTAPFNGGDCGGDLYHWHVEILPRLTTTVPKEYVHRAAELGFSSVQVKVQPR